MGVVNFYHLTRFTADEVVDMLLSRAMGQGWRVFLRSPDRAALERQDTRLWLQPEDGFMPHGLQGGPQDADQPVLLGAGAVTNGAQAVLLLGAQVLDAAEVRAVERVWLVFDGNDQDQVALARAQWKRVMTEGLSAQYWNDGSGRWEKKAEHPPPPRRDIDFLEEIGPESLEIPPRAEITG